MKNIIKSLLAIAGATMLISACSTDVEIKDPANLTDPDGNVLVLFESGAMAYSDGKYRTDHVWCLNLSQ